VQLRSQLQVPGGGERARGSAVFDAGYHVDRHSEVEHWVRQGETITNR